MTRAVDLSQLVNTPARTQIYVVDKSDANVSTNTSWQVVGSVDIVIPTKGFIVLDSITARWYNAGGATDYLAFGLQISGTTYDPKNGSAIGASSIRASSTSVETITGGSNAASTTSGLIHGIFDIEGAGFVTNGHTGLQTVSVVCDQKTNTGTLQNTTTPFHAKIRVVDTSDL